MSNRSESNYESVAFFENRNNIVTEWRMLVKLGLLRIKQECLNEILNIRSKLFSQNDRVLGVLLRGTDYVANRPVSYAPEFAASTVIQKLKE